MYAYLAGTAAEALAVRYGVNPQVIYKRLKEHGAVRASVLTAFNCKICGKSVDRGHYKPGVYCSLACKTVFQRTQKPVDEVWLRQKYLVEGVGVTAIARLVRRNTKQVYSWLKGYGIPVPERTWNVLPNKPYHQDREWLRVEYVDNNRTAADIAAQFSVTEADILFFLRKHRIVCRTMKEIRAAKYWGLSGETNGMFGKTGELSPVWKGGITPERQTFYRSWPWEKARRLLRKRDGGICRRCGVKKSKDVRFCIHHVVSFQVVALRADPDNLVTLCAKCHYWVHSKENANHDYIKTF